MKREKICLLVESNYPPNAMGGPSTVHLNLQKKLVELGYQVYILNYVKTNHLFNILKFQIFKIYSGIHILNSDYDIVITPLWQYQNFSRYILRYFVKKPYLLIVHGSDFFQSLYPKLIQEGFIFKSYAYFLAGSLKTIIDGSCGIISTEEIFNYMNSLNVDKKKYRPLNFLYDEKFFDSIDLGSPWEKDNKFHILFYGRFYENKGILYLIKAIPKIIKHSNKVKFHLVGNGPQKEEAIKFVNQNNLSSYVDFYDYIAHDKIKSFILAADCVVNPITWGAGIGTVSNEVLSEKKPLILGNANITVNNLYQTYKSYLVVKTYDSNDIADKVIMLMDNPELVQNLKQNIEKFINNEFNDEIIRKKLKNIIEESIIYYKKNIVHTLK